MTTTTTSCRRCEGLGIYGLVACPSCGARSKTTTKLILGIWGSNPAEQNDDQSTAFDFDDHEAAHAAYRDPSTAEGLTGYLERHASFADETWISLGEDEGDGECCSPSQARRIASASAEERRARARAARAEGAAWRQEIATEAGLGLGIDAYNDARGQR